MNANPSFGESVEIGGDEIVSALKKDGQKSDLVDRWLEGVQAKDALENLQVNIEWAEHYLKAGFPEEALEAFEDAANEALQLGETDLYNRCMGELESLRSS